MVKNDNLKQYKLLSLLSMLYITVILAANLVVYKIDYVNGIVFSAGSLLIPVWFIISSIIAEVYEYYIIKQIIRNGIICSLFFTIICYFSIRVPHPIGWNYQPYYDKILGSLPRVFLGSLLGIIVSSFTNAYLVVKSKFLFKGNYFLLRCVAASGIGEFIWTFSTIMFDMYRVNPMDVIFKIIFVSCSIKLIITMFGSIPITIITTYIKKYEGIEDNIYNSKFNPFSSENYEKEESKM